MSDAEAGFTGWKYYFNSYTRRGRFNVSNKGKSLSLQNLSGFTFLIENE